MKTLTNAILEGMITFVTSVIFFCVMMALFSWPTPDIIDWNTYNWLGWRIPMILGFARFVLVATPSIPWYNKKHQQPNKSKKKGRKNVKAKKHSKAK